MRVATTGSRSWTNSSLIEDWLLEYQTLFGDELHVCHGASPGGGSDKHVDLVCTALRITKTPYPAKASLDGPHPKVKYLNRNIRMLETFNPDVLLAFRSSGKSNGTDHTIAQAAKRNIPVCIIEDASVKELC